MIKFRTAAVGLAAAAVLATACSTAQTSAASGTVLAHTSGASSGEPAAPQAGPASSSTAGCGCYTPQQLQVAYGVKPLLDRGINGRGETVVFPELAESQLNPPQVSDLRQDMAAYDRRFRLPTPRMRVVATLAGASSPWLALSCRASEARTEVSGTNRFGNILD